MANLSEWQTCLHGKPVCIANMYAWKTCLHGKPVSLLVPVCLSAPQVFSLPVQENFLSVCQGLSFCRSILPSISVHLFSVSLPDKPSICMPGNPFLCLYVCLSVCLPGKPFLYLYVRLSVCLPGTPFVCADRCPVLKYSMYVLILFSQHGSDCQAGELDRIRGAPLYL
jgi:hypothetical protein